MRIPFLCIATRKVAILGAVVIPSLLLPPSTAAANLSTETTPGTIITVAGTGASGFRGDGGQATNAEIASPGGVATDVAGNLYIADTFNHVVRRVDTSGVITTVAGTTVAGKWGCRLQRGWRSGHRRTTRPGAECYGCRTIIWLPGDSGACVRAWQKSAPFPWKNKNSQSATMAFQQVSPSFASPVIAQSRSWRQSKTGRRRLNRLALSSSLLP